MNYPTKNPCTMFLSLILILTSFQTISYGDSKRLMHSSDDRIEKTNNQDVKASLEYSSRSGSKTINFTEEELRRIEKDIEYLREKLTREGVKCCAPRRKLSDCIWECCDNSQIRTCDPTLVKALESLIGRS